MANYVKFMRGSKSAYANLSVKDTNTLYFVYEQPTDTEGELFLGGMQLASNLDLGATSIDALKDVMIKGGLADKSFLVYDSNEKAWVNKTFDEMFPVFDGAVPGLVPAAPEGKTGYFLRSDGTWAPCDSTQQDVTILTNNDETEHATLLASVSNPTKNDIVIIKDLIAVISAEESKYQHTAYIFDGSNWAAFDGNYNASNIYFDEDFTFTKAVGTVTIPTSGSTTKAAKGKNLKEFLSGLFAEEAESTVTNPTVSALSMNKSGSYEAGTVITGLTYTATFEDGKYTYGPEPTGSEATEWTIKDNANNVVGSAATGDLADLTVQGDSTFSLKATAKYSNGSYAKTNLGNVSTKGTRIVAGTTASKNSSNSITGYWNTFYGLVDRSVKSDVIGIIDSAFIRENLAKVAYAAGDLDFGASANKKAMIVACPAHKAGITAAIMPSALNSPIPWVAGSPFTVKVEGATNAVSTNYNVWVYEPASIDASETYKITLG